MVPLPSRLGAGGAPPPTPLTAAVRAAPAAMTPPAWTGAAAAAGSSGSPAAAAAPSAGQHRPTGDLVASPALLPSSSGGDLGFALGPTALAGSGSDESDAGAFLGGLLPVWAVRVGSSRRRCISQQLALCPSARRSSSQTLYKQAVVCAAASAPPNARSMGSEGGPPLVLLLSVLIHAVVYSFRCIHPPPDAGSVSSEGGLADEEQEALLAVVEEDLMVGRLCFTYCFAIVGWREGRVGHTGAMPGTP